MPSEATVIGEMSSGTGAGSRLRPSRTAGGQPVPARPAEPAGTAPAQPSAPAEAPPTAPVPEPTADETAAPSGEATSTRSAPRTPRTGRIEVPVPSVVRARERGRIAEQNPIVLRTEMLTKTYGSLVAAGDVSIDVHAGSFTGFVGPNGAGKTTTLSMISGLLRPTSGRVTVSGVDVWADGPAAKRLIGTLPDRLRLFDRLTGAQLLYYSGVLHGVPEAAVATRSAELAEAFGLESALGRLVSDYSAGMQKKIALACSMIHAPEVLVLDEPFEAIDPVSASNVTEILERYVSGGGSVVMSSHSLDLIQRVCDHVSIIVDGSVIAQGTVDAVRDGLSLEERFVQLTGASETRKGLEWLSGSSDSE
ncbi:ABC transporter ATP-binding protein [Leucobacter chromiiresistens]|uniref:ABC-2 type transport system ATP-binding protein n=1 Tax=Leucobacter chromiiresistens TaxID=1079994 RepID=A0A1H1AAT8_9MICO|nr:ABC transporter ATP-binding protein [Leucobacter chromiiresistens]SDQ36835.1 ABC-2 type transport system ATP-binding protein [Leucobacter chromiiresistens]